MVESYSCCDVRDKTCFKTSMPTVILLDSSSTVIEPTSFVDKFVVVLKPKFVVLAYIFIALNPENVSLAYSPVHDTVSANGAVVAERPIGKVGGSIGVVSSIIISTGSVASDNCPLAVTDLKVISYVPAGADIDNVPFSFKKPAGPSPKTLLDPDMYTFTLSIDPSILLLFESLPSQYTIILPVPAVNVPTVTLGTGTSDSPGIINFLTDDHSLNVLSLYCHLNCIGYVSAGFKSLIVTIK